jgi:hypothetical protein
LGFSALSIAQMTLLIAAARDGASPDLMVFSSSRIVHFQLFGADALDDCVALAAVLHEGPTGWFGDRSGC